MKVAILIIQIVISIALVLLILLQSQGTGLSGSFGGSGGFYRSKRGVEKLFTYLTIVFIALFFVTSVALVLL